MSKTYPAGVFVIDGNVLRSERGSIMIRESWPEIERAVLAKRDDDLGRWRSKDHPEYVIYPHGDFVWVLNEVNPGLVNYPSRPRDTNESPYAAVAREYFDSIEPPKPWLAAKPGEVWELTSRGSTEAWIVERKDNRYCFFGDGFYMPLDNSIITAGRRIYPEADNV